MNIIPFGIKYAKTVNLFCGAVLCPITAFVGIKTFLGRVQQDNVALSMGMGPLIIILNLGVIYFILFDRDTKQSLTNESIRS